MRRILGVLSILFSLILVCCSCCTANIQPQTPPLTGPQIAKLTSDYTVALVYTYNNVTKPICTGVWVSRSVILTANHCVEGLAELIEALEGEHVDPRGLAVSYILANEVVEVGKEPAAIHKSTAFALYKSNDIALLKVVNPDSVPDHGIAQLAEKTPEQGEHLNIMGHVKGYYWSFITGTVSAYRKELPVAKTLGIDGPFMQASAPVYFGNSGGGAFNDKAELVGIVSFILAAPNTTCFIHLETVRGILQGWGIVPVKLDTSAPDPTLD